jgi:uncharacterized protein
MALLEDRTAPLYNRVTDTIDLTHLDIGSVLSILRDHADPTPERLLFLIERFQLIERKLPVFAKPEAKRSRYYLTDNLLRSWLAALASPVSAIAFRPLGELVEEADQRLAAVEGGALEKLVGQLFEERSRKGLGDFPITRRIQGFWDKSGTEIDLVVVNETDRTIGFGSCKRSAQRLLSDVNRFQQHVGRFLQAMPEYQGWTHRCLGISPVLSEEQRAVLTKLGVQPQDLNDLTRGLD